MSAATPAPAARGGRAAEWVYRGIWGALTRLFRVPAVPPTLPAAAGETLHAFQPAPEFLRYLKFIFWFWLTIIDGLILLGWIILTVAAPLAGLLTSPIFLAVAVLPDIVAYIAIHLRYDTTWYIVSPRSLRIRRGIWTIHETTITFENIQNVVVRQGPVQRHYGVSNLMVTTAGGGGGGAAAAHGAAAATGAHVGLIEGITDAHRIRDLILAHVAAAQTTGLGDDRTQTPAPAQQRGAGFTPDHIAALRQIRDLVVARPSRP